MASRNKSERPSVDCKDTPLIADITDYHIAKALAEGLATVHWREGRPDLALPLLIAGQQPLSRSGETLVGTYIDVLYAAMSIRVVPSDQVEATIAVFDRARGVFSRARMGHLPYQLETEYQLALAYLQIARNTPNSSKSRRDALDSATKCAHEIRRSAASFQDPIYECNGLIVESRIARLGSAAQEAEKQAQRALELGEDRTYTRVQALIARGEARLDLQRTMDAVQDFSSALKHGGDNPTVVAACHLHLARAYLRLRDIKRSREHFEEWQTLRERIQNPFIGWLEEQLRHDYIGDTSSASDFVVRQTEQDVDPPLLERRLREFLVDWAKARSANDAEAAARLRISKQTLYNWRRKNAKK